MGMSFILHRGFASTALPYKAISLLTAVWSPDSPMTFFV